MFSDIPRGVEIGAAALTGAAAYVLYNNASDAAKAKDLANAKYQAGEDYADPQKRSENFFSDPKAVAVALLADLKSVHGKFRLSQLIPLVEQVLKKGEPLDDKKGTTELLINILTKLPRESVVRRELTNKLIDTLWDNLQHPPLSYVGGDIKYEVVDSRGGDHDTKDTVMSGIEFQAPDDPQTTLRGTVPKAPDGMFQYRTPDGSYNNILSPHLGQAGTSYAKSIRTSKRLHGVKPDEGLLFDMLMARDENNFRENPAGISSILFYHASIIIHDIFRTNRANMNISDTSSYLDLAPLYGSSLKDQLEIRTMREGKLKPDTFHEKRLLGQPPGVNVMLVLYSRFHNYVADILLKINEGGRFTLAVPEGASPDDVAKAVAKQDHDLFNTARLIVGGLYVNICLHDYLRAITNTHHSDSDWTLDPRVEIGKQFDSEGTPRGIGNQVSVEFNLLYRFHACISKRDEKWINEFFCGIFPDRTPESLSELTPGELLKGLVTFEARTPKDPSQRTFGGLQRQKDGRFRDEDLVRILKESIEDPAGCFGARMVPKALKVVETLGILQARKWQVGSLNEFREFFGLKRYSQFKDISSNKDIQDILEKLYTHPDMVELYPGLMVEDIKPAMNPGCGICPTYSVGRAVLSDAVTLVRSDRFNTIDYNVSNLTAWGYNEVQQDYKTLGGSMFYKLIQRGVPGWFPYNSLHVMQPMFTKKMNQQIATEIGTIKQYTLDDPKPPRATVVVASHSGVRQVLEDHGRFVVPWLPAINSLWPGEKDFSWFMLGGDKPENAAHKQLMQKVLMGIPDFSKILAGFIANEGKALLDRELFKMKDNLYQLDLIRDIAIPMNARVLADLFYFDINTHENPKGTLGAADVYKHLLNIRTWGVNNNDAAMAWNRRRWAQESAQVMVDSTRELVHELAFGPPNSLMTLFKSCTLRKNSVRAGSLRSCGRGIAEALLAHGKSVDEVVDTLWLTAFGGVGVPVTAFCEIMQFFLLPENTSHWSKVQDLAARNDDQTLRAYVLEALRVTSTQRDVRIATTPATIDGQSINPGSAVVLMLGAACRDASVVNSPSEFRPGRTHTLTPFSTGMHACFGREIAMTYMTGLVKLVAGLKELRPAPGIMGQVKSIVVGTEKCYLNDSWSWLTFETSTWKMHCAGRGKGVWRYPNLDKEKERKRRKVEKNGEAWDVILDTTETIAIQHPKAKYGSTLMSDWALEDSTWCPVTSII
ncbi:hypothetical protein DL763_000889 [Monosporascus cannonballus]|nr:hypothetical protein DL763_000889 [Monosporascus cannonballus]